MNNKMLKIISATAFSLSGLLFANVASATIKYMHFGNISQANNFCSADNIHCDQIETVGIGYLVYYEVVNTTSSGPKRDDGDNDADCGNTC